MSKRYCAIRLLQDFGGIKIMHYYLDYISRLSGIEYDKMIYILFDANLEIVKKEGVSYEAYVLAAPITYYQVASFAFALEKHVCQLLTELMRSIALMRPLNESVLQSLSSALYIDDNAIRIFLYSSKCRRFTKAQDTLLLKAAVNSEEYESIVNYLLKSGRQRLEIKYRIGTLYNVNYFDKAEVEYMLTVETPFLNNELLGSLCERGAELRFSCQLSNWYAGNEEHFWAFPANL